MIYATCRWSLMPNSSFYLPKDSSCSSWVNTVLISLLLTVGNRLRGGLATSLSPLLQPGDIGRGGDSR